MAAAQWLLTSARTGNVDAKLPMQFTGRTAVWECEPNRAAEPNTCWNVTFAPYLRLSYGQTGFVKIALFSHLLAVYNTKNASIFRLLLKFDVRALNLLSGENHVLIIFLFFNTNKWNTKIVTISRKHSRRKQLFGIRPKVYNLIKNIYIRCLIVFFF